MYLAYSLFCKDINKFMLGTKFRVSTHSSYWGRVGLESWSRDWLYWSSSQSSRKLLRYCSKIGKDRFLLGHSRAFYHHMQLKHNRYSVTHSLSFVRMSVYIYVVYLPITVTARSKPWTVFARSNAGIVDSNPTQDIDDCVWVYCVFVLPCVCVGSGLTTGWSPVQGVLRSV
jgi:hypothetical protein